LKMGLIDGSFPRSRWSDGVGRAAAELAERSPGRETEGITLPKVEAPYRYVSVELDETGRVATLTLKAPDTPAPADPDALRAEGAQTWSMAAFRELDDALLHLRFNHELVGLILLRTEGDPEAVRAHDR